MSFDGSNAAFGSPYPLHIHLCMYLYFFAIGTFGVFCSVQKLLWQRDIIVIDTDFNEICNNIRISAFGACCIVAKKVFRYP